MSRCLARHLGDRGRERPGAGHDPVRDGGVLDRPQLVDAADRERGGADAVDVGTHCHEHLAQVADLRLPGDVVDHGLAGGEHRGHQQVLGGADAREVEPQVGAAQPAGNLGDDEAVLDADLGAELAQAGDVHVQPARTDVVPARQRDARAAAPRDERAEHADRRAQTTYQLVRRLVLQLLRSVDAHGERGGRLAGLRLDGDRRAELLEQPRHHVHVEDVGHVRDRRAPLGEQGGGHQLQRAVLGTVDGDLAVQRRRQRTARDDLEAFHPADASARRTAPGRTA